MIAGAICLSHSPLLDQACADASQPAGFHAAVAEAAGAAAAWSPDLCIVFYPDHFNGFFYDLMAPFCIGTAAVSVGDYGTAPGEMNVAADQAESLAAFILAQGVDVGLSYAMRVDHGVTQPIEMLSRGQAFPPIIPIFINSAAAPLPPFARARALGRAAGEWAIQSGRRVLLLASGGLSHDPPLPNIRAATGDARAALIDGRPMTHAARAARQQRVRDAAHAAVGGAGTTRKLAPDWDRAVLDALRGGKTDFADGWVNDDVTAQAGRGAHETRTWIAACAALQAAGPYHADILFYAPIVEWLTGMGVLRAQPTRYQ
jgi:2,3-dihydroxyphenylpropionate 1,2-dioxygenase